MYEESRKSRLSQVNLSSQKEEENQNKRRPPRKK